MLCYVMSYSNKYNHVMLNDDGNENGRRYQLFLLAKKSFTSVARFFVHFARRQRETSQLHILYRKSRMCSLKLLLLVSLFALFSLPLIVASLAASSAHFLTANFHVLIRVFCSVSNALPLSLLSTPVKTKKCSQTRFCPGGHAMTRQKT